MKRFIISTSFLLCAAIHVDAATIPKAQPYEPAAPPPAPTPAAPEQPAPAPGAPAAAAAPAAPSPWLTGPLIVPIGTVIAYGDFEVETYVYATTNTGSYNKHWDEVSAPRNFTSINPQFLFFFGLTSWADINLIPQLFYNTTADQNNVDVGDFTAGLDFQFFDAEAATYFPGIKLAIRETFPTGKYQYLKAEKLLTDQTGAGAYATTFDLVLYKVYHLGGQFFLSTTYSAAYTLNTAVHVHKFNTYGGGHGTNGRVVPGGIFQGIISFELALSQNWVLAIDNVYTHTNETKFSGDPGTSAPGVAASVGGPSNEQISFAPAIEYNFSSHFGIIAGCWFSAWGRNSTEFRSGVINFDYTY